jgi:hypothetical protein
MGYPVINYLPVTDNKAFDPLNCPIIIPTAIQIAEDIMNYFTSMTCLYNRYWYAEQERITLPIAMFHVKSITETWQNEVSKKRVIMYEPPNSQPADADLSDSLRAGVMQAFMDNTVVQPKSYQMEVVVPFQPIGKYINEGVSTAISVFDGIMELFKDDAGSGIFQSFVSSVRAVLGLMDTVVDIAGLLPDSGGINMVNKNSLEAMAESGKILTMKMWTGYQYKYVMITGMTATKQAYEENVFRGTLQLQEMPVLTMTTPKKPRVKGVVRLLEGLVKTGMDMQAALVAPLIQSLGVVEASGQKNDLTAAVKAAAGL